VADGPHAQIDREVGFERQTVEEIALDALALVAERDDELGESEMGVVFHDVPEDRPSADLHHRLGPDGGFFRQPRPLSTGKDRYLHDAPLAAVASGDAVARGVAFCGS